MSLDPSEDHPPRHSLHPEKDSKPLSQDAEASGAHPGLMQQSNLESGLHSGNFHGYQPEMFEGRHGNVQSTTAAASQSQAAPPSTPGRILDKITSEGHKLPNAFPNNNEQYSLFYEREVRWNEVRKYSEVIRRFVSEASGNLDMTKENFYDLYNMAISLLKSVDSLDPDKMKRPGELESQMPTPQLTINPNVAGMPLDLSEIFQARKGFELYYGRSSADANLMAKYGDPALFYSPGASISPTFLSQLVPPFSSVPKGDSAGKNPKNFTGEVFFDDLTQQQDDPNRRKSRRRRRTPYSTKRNLHCHMCGVTETPEWRRGPAGDHTLCNACGLHYSKSLKKQRKEREGRKPSVDMLLNQGGQAAQLHTISSSGTGASET